MNMEKKKRSREEVRYRKKFIRTLRDTIHAVIVISAVAVLITNLMVPVLRIYGHSMNDTLDEGNIVLGDEMLTPDSSRFWPLEGYEAGRSQPSYDKQFVRDWLKANPDSDYLLPQDVIDRTIEKYKEAYTLLTGETF